MYLFDEFESVLVKHMWNACENLVKLHEFRTGSACEICLMYSDYSATPNTVKVTDNINGMCQTK